MPSWPRSKSGRGGSPVDPDFARQYYESAGSDHWWFRGRKYLVEGLLGRAGVESGRFVDLGAGAESLLPHDLDVVKLDIVRPQTLPKRFVQASAEALPFPDAAFDGAGLFDILEHLPDPGVCLSEVRRVVRPGGLVIVTVPAHRRLWSPHDDLVGHERRYSSGELQASLSEAGLDVRWISSFYGFLVPPAMVRSLLSLHSPMALPQPGLNRRLSSLAVRSVERALRRGSRVGLSIGAVGVVP
jgi:SAM-dependent methyltransferase